MKKTVFRSLVAVGVLALASAAMAEPLALSRQFNAPGNILISDQFNNRVIEIDPTGKIVWSFGRGPNDFTAKSIIGVNDAQRVGPFTLMAGTGTPPGVIPQAVNGFADNRVILVDPSGKILWQYGQFGMTGSRYSRPHHRSGQQPHHRGERAQTDRLAISRFQHQRRGSAQ